MSDRWNKWRALSWADRWLLVRAALLLLRTRASLAETRFQPMTDDEPAGAGPASQESRLPRAQHVARVVGMASAGMPGTFTCLHRSLVTWHLLHDEGIPCRLRLGAAGPGEGLFEAHAWVECGGVPLGEQDAHLARYNPFGKAVVPAGRRA